MKSVLFVDPPPPLIPDHIVPFTCSGGVTEGYLAYHHALKMSIQHFEVGKSSATPPTSSILSKDPYYVTKKKRDAAKLSSFSFLILSLPLSLSLSLSLSFYMMP